MRMFKCEVCGESYEDYKEVRHIEIRRYKNIVDVKPVLVRSLDMCNKCVLKIFGEGKEKDV